MNEIFTRLNDTIRKTKYLCFLLLASSALQAQTKWYVNDNSTSGDIYTTAVGNNANAGTSASAPKLTLGAAFTAAAAGDIIYVDKGTFTGSGNIMFTFNKAITIIGAGTGNTIFTSHTNDRFATIAANNVTIQNLQLYDFFLASGNGQALLVNANITGFKLTNVVMKKNYGSSGTGESIYLSSGSSSTFDGLFFSCSGFNGASGGAIKVNSCTLDVKNSAFSQSRDADGKGGAIEISGATSVVTVDNTSFDGNSARAGGAIAHNAGKLYVTNSCFNRNYIQGDSSSSTNGGGHYYAASADTNLIASFTNCKFQGAFFCATTNPTGYVCEASTNTSNDGAAISLRGSVGTYSFDTCLFDNSNMPAYNFDNGLDFYVQPNGALLLTINNSKFANDLTNFHTDARNIYISGALNNTTQKVIVTNSGASAAANRDGNTGNNFSLFGTLTTGSNSLTATSDATASCGSTIAGCTITINCANEANAPVITACAPNQTLSSCSGTLPDYRPLIAAFDDCDFTISQSPAPGTSLSSLGNGNHTITFTVSDQSPNSADTTCTMVLTLSGCYTCNPSLSYPNSGVCSASTAVTPTFSPSGGTFTSTTGLTIDASTGVITPSTSTAGTYTITYTPNASYPTCTTTSTFTITAAPAQPTIACYQTATLNAATCTWEVTGTQPAQPAVACYETATFNTTTCSWDVTGTQPAQPTVACYETATFNTSSCSWDVTGTQPAQPTVACYETATFNTTSCSWDVTGTQPAPPTMACYESGTFNTTTCSWDVIGTQPEQPTLNCYETAIFNTTICAWDVTGTELKATATSGTINCNGGRTNVIINITGGLAPYSISPEQTTDLPAGLHEFTVTDANGCSTTASIEINEPNALSLTTSSGTISCNGGLTDVVITPLGGTAPYLISPEQAGLPAGLHEFTVTDANGCSATATIDISEPKSLFALVNPGKILCNGGTADVEINVIGGTAPYTITPEQTNLSAGTHEFSIIDANGCPTSTSVTLLEPEVHTASIISSKGNAFCFGETTTLSASNGESYIWSNGATTPSISVNVSGIYSVTVKNSNGCSATASINIDANYCSSICPTEGNLIQNGSFENPSIQDSFRHVRFQNWTNLVDNNTIEVHKNFLNIQAPDGNQYIEIMGHTHGDIYQDVNIIGNKSLKLSFKYRARTTSREVIRVTIYDPINNSNVYSFNSIGNFNEWVEISANYTTSPNQTKLRVKIQGIGARIYYMGNLIDDVKLNYIECLNDKINIIGSNVLCESSPITTLSVSNIENAVSYLWNNGETTPSININRPGTYFVKVNFTNGTYSISEPFIVRDFLTNASIIGNTAFCSSSTNSLTATGGSSYLWNTGETTATINTSIPGNYSVLISNSNGCNITKEITVVNYDCTPSYCPSINNLLSNASFEFPEVSGNCWDIIPVQSWTNSVNKIEIQKSGCISINAPNGNQYVELMGHVLDINQDVTVLANKTFKLSFMYRARSSSNESIKVTLFDPTNNSNIYSFNVSGTTNVWKKITANYSSAVNQTKIRVKIEGITGNHAFQGNLIDDINLNYLNCAESSAEIIGNNQICNGSSTTLSLLNNNNIVSYLWSTGATTPIISVNQAGNYSVTVTYNDGTTLTSPGFNISTCDVIINKSNANTRKIVDEVINYNVILYPNPTVSSFSLNVVSDSVDAIEVSVYDIQGRNIENKTFNKEDINSITIGDNLPSGIYNVVVKQGENVKSQRLIKK